MLIPVCVQFHHREPGIAGLLGSRETDGFRRPFYSVIADGVHVHQNAIRIAYDAHPKGAILVTDAIAPMGLPPGTYAGGDHPIFVTERGEAYLDGTKTLAGRCGAFMPWPMCVRVYGHGKCGCTHVCRYVCVSLCVAHARKGRTVSRPCRSVCATLSISPVRRWSATHPGADTLIRSHMDTECSTVEALQAATLHPAQLLGIRHRKGTLDVGADADLVVLDDDLNVRATFVRGALVYKVGA
jgi:N-acetylglucosamine-6-phosphate deacetylase